MTRMATKQQAHLSTGRTIPTEKKKLKGQVSSFVCSSVVVLREEEEEKKKSQAFTSTCTCQFIAKTGK